MTEFTESVRLKDPLAGWVEDWCDKYGQTKSQVLRAGLTLLIYAIDDLPLDAKLKFIAEYSNHESITQLRKPDLMAFAAANLQAHIATPTKRDAEMHAQNLKVAFDRLQGCASAETEPASKQSKSQSQSA